MEQSVALTINKARLSLGNGNTYCPSQSLVSPLAFCHSASMQTGWRVP